MDQNVVVVGDEISANHALRLIRKNRVLVWRGDYWNARQLLRALKRRVGKSPLLKSLLVELGPEYQLGLRRAPDVTEACTQAYGPCEGPRLVALQELVGVLSAHEWRVRGVYVEVLGERIHPHYGVFAPTRQDYLELVANAEFEGAATAFDIGTGTGVIAILLARRGTQRVVATDIEPRAVACARENAERLAPARIQVEERNLFPAGKADLVVSNPPWLPGVPQSALHAGVYDQGMLQGFLDTLPAHLNPGGEAWLVMSDLAERLGLRGSLTELIQRAGLQVAGRLDTRPSTRIRQGQDPLAAVKAQEIISLWRLKQAHLHRPDTRLEPAAGVELDHGGGDVAADCTDADT
ncbi:methylase of polypeptide subunit release factors [Kibdelosporangium banguiense]|uniref:Methylase of polypeptide subunit release factors n=1 Tax=Kibdelosporangium banguiense TaxID=1365924 RepID=A0ABS4T759_9PSEU|nr:class I SAM-dependent methyltransferase [Kibdelosporangium banguiense]MBP2320266.1 methylase of polypeptide subunit release factors [Kibdelosporangium banguiense]